ncbi:MAG TPA: thioesterase domain-containing protein, partial [Blastocatellia bacterium]|nr:thioesterase domain-containing protein [Blastocatellia bacterium]
EQVKVRGMRVEVGEVEEAVRGQAGVREAVVVAREEGPGDVRLVAYVVAQDGSTLTSEDLLASLRKKLPGFMVPSAIIMMEQLPVTANGKIDRRALPAPKYRAADGGQSFVAPRDALEFALSRIWGELLGIQPVGIHDNFFDLGGHSLLAIRLINRIHQTFGVELPVATLFQGPTIESQASSIRRDATAPPHRSLVPIRTEGTRKPFFCVHPAGGNVFSYVNLARHLGPDQPFYGLQAQGLDGASAPMTEIEAMAALYVQAVRSVQPSGPYILGGWSMGGVVAFEMASQLKKAGQEVSLLALFDSYLMSDAAEREDELDLLAGFAQDLGLPVGGLAASWGEVVNLEADERLDFIFNQAVGLGLIPPDVGPGHLRTLFDVFKANARALRRYAPQSMSQRVALFLAQDQLTDEPSNPVSDWGRLSGGDVEVHRVSGNHFTMLREPNVSRLAELFRLCMDEAEES